MRARWYDAHLGRFLSEDPIGLAGGINPYAYANNSPNNLRDPSGMIPWPTCGTSMADDLFTGGITVTCGPTISGLAERWQRDWMARTDAWQTSFSMFGDFLSGKGPTHRTFGPGTRQVEEMSGAHGVNGARTLLCSKYAAGQTNPSVTRYGSAFGARRLIGAGLNATQQFVGSYNVNIYGNADGTATFHVSNTTSMKSFLYHLPFVRSYDRRAAAALAPYGISGNLPGGNMYQTYTWTEQYEQACR